MPVVFSQNAGRVSAVTDEVAAGSISLGRVEGDEEISYVLQKTIITRIGLSAAGNFQFLHTVGNDVYVYVFGDRMGQIVLHGLSFAQACPQAVRGAQNTQQAFIGAQDSKHGFQLLYEWYKRNRIAARKLPITATIGLDSSFEGFLTALSGDVQDPLHRTIQFQLTLATLPGV